MWRHNNEFKDQNRKGTTGCLFVCAPQRWKIALFTVGIISLFMQRSHNNIRTIGADNVTVQARVLAFQTSVCVVFTLERIIPVPGRHNYCMLASEWWWHYLDVISCEGELHSYSGTYYSCALSWSEKRRRIEKALSGRTSDDVLRNIISFSTKEIWRSWTKEGVSFSV